jgi:hypothetical protein
MDAREEENVSGVTLSFLSMAVIKRNSEELMCKEVTDRKFDKQYHWPQQNCYPCNHCDDSRSVKHHPKRKEGEESRLPEVRLKFLTYNRNQEDGTPRKEKPRCVQMIDLK